MLAGQKNGTTIRYLQICLGLDIGTYFRLCRMIIAQYSDQKMLNL